jgi:hypothetical protein
MRVKRISSLQRVANSDAGGQSRQWWQSVSTTRFCAGVVTLPEKGIRCKLATGGRTKLIDGAANFFAYGATQGDAAYWVVLGTPHAGHDIVDLLD